jgi:hypothetical protein
METLKEALDFLQVNLDEIRNASQLVYAINEGLCRAEESNYWSEADELEATKVIGEVLLAVLKGDR